MQISIHPTAQSANEAAAALFGSWLNDRSVRNVMLAAGNTPLDLYRLIAERKFHRDDLNLFALDEYVGVPLNEPRNCANLIRRTAAEPWGIAPQRYHTISSREEDALESALAHEKRIGDAGGLDALVLGLGQNGHLGFNEPGSAEASGARVLDLNPISIEANRKWFHGVYAPARGVTVGMKTILAARRILLLAFGEHKIAAATAMIEGARTEQCPASLLQGHPAVWIYLDGAAAAGLKNR